MKNSTKILLWFIVLLTFLASGLVINYVLQQRMLNDTKQLMSVEEPLTLSFEHALSERTKLTNIVYQAIYSFEQGELQNFQELIKQHKNTREELDELLDKKMHIWVNLSRHSKESKDQVNSEIEKLHTAHRAMSTTEEAVFSALKNGNGAVVKALLLNDQYTEQGRVYSSIAQTTLAEDLSLDGASAQKAIESSQLFIYINLVASAASVLVLIIILFAMRSFLIESFKKYKLLYDFSSDALMTLEPPHWKFTDGNPAALALFGIKDRNKFCSFTPGDLSPEKQPDGQLSKGKALQAIKTALEKGSHTFDWMHQTIDGRTFDANVLLSKITESDKVYLQAVVRDITEVNKVQLELKNSENFLSNIIESIPHMIFVKDAENLRFVKLNKAGEHLLGYKREDLLGKNDYDLFPKEEADFFVQADRNVLASGKMMEITEEKLLNANKEERVLHTRKVPLTDINGAPRFLLGISEDITELLKTERMNRVQLSALEATSNAILISDATGKIEWTNTAWSLLTGYSKEEAIGNNPRVLKSGMHPPEFYANLWKTISSGKIWESRIINKRKNGTLYNEDEVITPVFDPTDKNKIIHFIAVKQLVSEHVHRDNS